MQFHHIKIHEVSYLYNKKEIFIRRIGIVRSLNRVAIKRCFCLLFFIVALALSISKAYNEPPFALKILFFSRLSKLNVAA